jgi:hypothetical protein
MCVRVKPTFSTRNPTIGPIDESLPRLSLDAAAHRGRWSRSLIGAPAADCCC